MNSTILNKAIYHAEEIKHSKIDTENHIIEIPFGSSVTKEDLLSEGMLGEWYKNNGFDISFRKGDYEYQTKGNWLNYRARTRSKGHTAYLRNRLILTVTW